MQSVDGYKKTLTVKDCDILEATEKLIVQQVNCVGKMGKGLALEISNKYTKLKDQYQIHCMKNLYSRNLLGTVFYHHDSSGKIIANLFGQYEVNKYFQQTNYLKLAECFINLNNWCKDNNITEIAIPHGIGCGLGGGDWDKVRKIIVNTLTDVPKITLYKYQP